MLLRVRQQGRAPGMMVHIGPDREPWVVRASLMAAGPGPVFLLQLGAAGSAQPGEPRPAALPVEDIIDRLPEGFVVVDHQGVIRRANRAFLDLVQLGTAGSVVGERLGRWLSHPGANLTVLLANVHRHGSVRMFSTTLQGELGIDTEVEISAVGNADRQVAVFRRADPRHQPQRVPARRRRLPAYGAAGHHRADRQGAAAGTGAEDHRRRSSVTASRRRCDDRTATAPPPPNCWA